MLKNSPEKNLFIYCLNDPINKIDVLGAICTDFNYPKMLLSYNPNTPLGNGWYYRIDAKNTQNEHIHLFHKNKNEGWYAQNKDGSIHDKHKNGPNDGPPSNPKKKLKEKSGWDWDKRKEEYEQKDKSSKFALNPINDYASAVGWAVSGYAIYRIIRLGVSLIPPLWPTLPANVIAP